MLLVLDWHNVSIDLNTICLHWNTTHVKFTHTHFDTIDFGFVRQQYFNNLEQTSTKHTKPAVQYSSNDVLTTPYNYNCKMCKAAKMLFKYKLV